MLKFFSFSSWLRLQLGVCILMLMSVGQVAAQTPDTKEPLFDGSKPETVRILGISVQGLITIEEKDVLSRLGIKVKDEITIPGLELANAIKQIWKQRLFSDVKISIEKKTLEGVFLVVSVKEYPVLEKVTFEGNKEFDTDDLLKKVSLIKGGTVTDQALTAAVQSIRKMYEEDGYLAADITYDVQETANNKARITFRIVENKRVFIDRITFHGNRVYKNDDLRGELDDTKQNNFWRSIFGRPKLDRKKFEEDKTKLIAFYKDNGYRDARVVSDSVSYSPDKKKLYLDITLYEGPKYVIRNVAWDGNTLPFATTDVLNQRFGFKKGDLYNQKRLQERLSFSQNSDDVSSLYLDSGYLTFHPDMEETVVPGDSVDLKISMTEGNQFRLGKVILKGNTKTKDRVIRRELRTVPGDLFSREALIRSQRELATLNYFDPEKIGVDYNLVDKETVDITYSLVEKQTDTFNASMGYSGSYGLTGSLGVTFNNFSAADIFKSEAYDPLPHGDGQKLALDFQFGQQSYQSKTVSFTEPWAFDTPTSIGVSIFDTKQDYIRSIQQTGASVSVGRRLSWPDDYFRIDWTVRFQQNLGGNSVTTSALNEPYRSDELSIIQVISRNSFDAPIFPRRGSEFALSTQISGGFLPGNVNFYKIGFSASWNTPITRDLILNISAKQGFIGRFKDSDYIPYVNLFYMGGSGLSALQTISLRGYDDRSVGSLDNQTGLIDGYAYGKYGTELRFPITLNPTASVWVLGFAEAGNTWLAINDFNLSDLKRSAGFGIRVFLPIVGLVGLDYGFGFDATPAHSTSATQGWKLNFTFGQSAQ
jgi:outer membrane protein insertion porin family